MAKELRVLTTLIADPTSVPLNHIRKLTTIVILALWESNVVYKSMCTHMHKPIHRYPYIHIIKIK